MPQFQSLRPSLKERAFVSASVENCIQEMNRKIADPELAWLFSNCFPNTLDTTVRPVGLDGSPDTFVITGDIPAMWLRDSTAQVWPYLKFLRDDEPLRELIAGVVHRQVECVLYDPYANAFEPDPAGLSKWMSDMTDMKPGLHERKYELDSLAAVLRLSRGYYEASGDSSIFTTRWRAAMVLILDTIEHEQEIPLEGEKPAYSFERVGHVGVDSTPLKGGAYPGKRCGLSRCCFRPSDDAMIMPFLVPANAMAVVELRHCARILREVLADDPCAARATRLADEIDEGIRRTGVVDHPTCGRIFAYEVDGYGSYYFMDDANIPSLLSLPYLGYCPTTDDIYRNTRRALLSRNNPFYSEGRVASGIGGPHVGPGHIWPMSIIVQALTADNELEVRYCLQMLRGSHGGTGWMHESFWKDDSTQFTREWFAWVNTLFGELIIHIDQKWPEVLSSEL